jgi:CDP-diglyceride synthetase
MSDILLEIHSRVGNTAFYYFVIMALWGIWRFIRKQGIAGNFWDALIIGGVLVILQGLMGIYLYFFGPKLTYPIHMLYGGIAAILLPLIFLFARRNQDRRKLIISLISFIFLIAAIVMALKTAGMMLVFK